MINFYRIKSTQFEQAAKDIAALFPGEIAETYFVPYRPFKHGLRKQPARGKLWSRYINLKGALRLANAGKEQLIEKPNSSLIPSKEDEEKLRFLKLATEPFDKILSYWEDTFLLRKNRYRDFELEDIYKDFPCLKLQFGIQLVSSALTFDNTVVYFTFNLFSFNCIVEI